MKLLAERSLATDVAEPLPIPTNAVDFIRHRELPEGWLRAARLTAGVRMLTVSGDPSTHWAARPAPILAFGWRDCQSVFLQILARARQNGARAVAIGHPEWQDQASILRLGGWVFPEPPRIEELLCWLVKSGGGADASVPAQGCALSPPTLLVHRTLRYVLIDGQEVPLQPRELALLRLLYRGGSPCLGTSALSQALLDASGPKQRRVLAQHLHSLRSKLGRFGAHIEFTRTGGYRTWLHLQWLHIADSSRDTELPRELHR